MSLWWFLRRIYCIYTVHKFPFASFYQKLKSWTYAYDQNDQRKTLNSQKRLAWKFFQLLDVHNKRSFCINMLWRTKIAKAVCSWIEKAFTKLKEYTKLFCFDVLISFIPVLKSFAFFVQTQLNRKTACFMLYQANLINICEFIFLSNCFRICFRLVLLVQTFKIKTKETILIL
jgi:hypothetical protein